MEPITFTTVSNFFDHPLFKIVGGITVLLALVTFAKSIFQISWGVLPVWLRLGKGLHGRKIAVFADSDEYRSLESMLVDSGIFKKRNIEQIHHDSLGKAEKYSIYLVHWPSFKDKINAIGSMKKDSDALILYAPQRPGEDENDGRVDQVILNNLNGKRNFILVNFRGRLLNDLLTAMITTSFEKK